MSSRVNRDALSPRQGSPGSIHCIYPMGTRPWPSSIQCDVACPEPIERVLLADREGPIRQAQGRLLLRHGLAAAFRLAVSAMGSLPHGRGGKAAKKRSGPFSPEGSPLEHAEHTACSRRRMQQCPLGMPGRHYCGNGPLPLSHYVTTYASSATLTACPTWGINLTNRCNGLVLRLKKSVGIAAVSPCHLASRWAKIVFNTL